MLIALSEAGGSGPACVAELGYGCGVGFLGNGLQAFSSVSAFAHGWRLGSGLFAVGAYVGVEAHDAGEGARRVVVCVAARTEERVGGGRIRELGIVKSSEGGEACLGLSVL